MAFNPRLIRLMENIAKMDKAAFDRGLKRKPVFKDQSILDTSECNMDFREYPDGVIDIDAMTPLMVITIYERMNPCIVCIGRKHRDEFDWDYTIPCRCEPIANMKIKNIIISIVGCPVSSTPKDSIYHIDTIYGIKDIPQEGQYEQDINIDDVLLRKDITGLEHITFSIHSSMDEQDKPNLDIIKELFTYIDYDEFSIDYSSTFHGTTKIEHYAKYFVKLINEYMQPITNSSTPEKKPNPHTERKKKGQ